MSIKTVIITGTILGIVVGGGIAIAAGVSDFLDDPIKAQADLQKKIHDAKRRAILKKGGIELNNDQFTVE